MKVSLSWLNKFFESPQSLGDVEATLNRIGLTVDTIENPADLLKDFCVVEIQGLEPHPNADKLKLCRVWTGNETLQVVCGDTTIYEGMKGVLARPGMYVPGLDVTLKPAEIRGVASQGMFCSSSELGLKDKSEGVIKLDSTAEVGARYVDVMGMDDPVLDIELTPNRGDCTSIYGIARDLAAAGLGKLKAPEIKAIKEDFNETYTIKIDTGFEGGQGCPLFMGRIIKGVQNGPSPLWLQSALQAIGVRSISALVDVTNFMAYHLGRPMHVFDMQKLKGPLQVRFSKEGETLKALDEEEYTLPAQTLVIADDQGAVSIAGIMGGLESGCSFETTNVFLESAYFDPVLIAKTGQRLKIISDSRYRFERGVDPAMVAPGLELATQMIVELCGGKVSQVITSGAVPTISRTIAYKPSMVQSLGGMQVAVDEQNRFIKAIGCEIKEQGETWQVTTPSWRHDMEGAPDVVEEVMRLKGYDHIQLASLPDATLDEALPEALDVTDRFELLNSLRRLLAGRGLNECETWTFIPETQAQRFGGFDPSHRLINPISQEMAVMRPSLLPNLIEGAVRNHARGLTNSALFEMGLRYGKQYPLDQENIVTGLRTQAVHGKHWLETTRPVDIYDVKADLLAVLDALGIGASKVQISTDAIPQWFHPGRSAVIQQGPKRILGVFGELHPQVLKDMDADGPMVAFEVYLDRISSKSKGHGKTYLTIPQLQGLNRDFAFILPEGVLAEKLIQAVQKSSPDLIESVDIFDVFRGKGIPDGMKSVAINIRLQPKDKTLTEQDLTDLMTAVTQRVNTELGGVLRS